MVRVPILPYLAVICMMRVPIIDDGAIFDQHFNGEDANNEG